MARACALLFAAFALSGCVVDADHPAIAGGGLPALVQAHRFAYQGDVPGAFQLSPNGRKLAWVGPFLMRSALFVRDNATGETQRYRARSAVFYWTPDSRRLLYTNDSSGSENTHVYMIDVADTSTNAIDLTPYPGVRASIHQVLANDPDHILVRHNRRDRKLFDLYRIDLNSVQEMLVALNPGDAVSPITARDGSVHGWKRSRDTPQMELGTRRPFSVRRSTLTKKSEETFRILGASPDRSLLWALSNRGRDHIALVAAHPTLGWEKVLFEDTQVDVTRVVMSRVTGAPLLASSSPGFPHDEILDSGLRDDLKALLDAQGSKPFGFDIVSTDDSEMHLIVSTFTSVQRRYYFVDRSAHSYLLLAEGVPDDLAKSLAEVRPVSFESRDGLVLHGYLTLPRGIPAKGLPTVLLVHGGPWSRTFWGDPTRNENAMQAQFLANRGYAVLQVDFRGSSGYGYRFLSAGIGEFAGKMHEDLLDAMRWAVESGTADPARVAIMGWSYGGYAALVGLTKTPEVFACGISIGGPTDLASLIESFPPYWSVDLSMWHDYVGDPSDGDDRELMAQKSPLSYAGSLQRPVLIVHGAIDVRVRIDQAERMVEALRHAGKPVEYLPISDMGHGLGYWAHHLAILRKSEDFLHRCIGGRASRFDPFDVVSWIWTRIAK